MRAHMLSRGYGQRRRGHRIKRGGERGFIHLSEKWMMWNNGINKQGSRLTDCNQMNPFGRAWIKCLLALNNNNINGQGQANEFNIGLTVSSSRLTDCNQMNPFCRAWIKGLLALNNNNINVQGQAKEFNIGLTVSSSRLTDCNQMNPFCRAWIKAYLP
ncbi:hypothetical protein CHS0354_013835 [Potamilus streckersoni]|uniref:Uncharacterized protein n=1 Tax=Potamilus streckersoni TaxID=2493646 RepID=A0AAE0T716_9BIVA|nr:hypothetical protein CHS0354_013835 [Potamilus streckersoni]